jgi:hypothetical protein
VEHSSHGSYYEPGQKVLCPERLPRPRGEPLVPIHNATGTKGWGSSPGYAVQVAQPGVKPCFY